MELKYKRVLLKMSGEVLGSDSSPVDSVKVAEAARHVKQLYDAGVKVGVVLGGGNIMRGRSAAGVERNRADSIGMLATAINSLSLEQALIDLNVPVRVLSAIEIEAFMDTYSARLANKSLDNGEVVIFACGMGAPFFSTDTAAALRITARDHALSGLVICGGTVFQRQFCALLHPDDMTVTVRRSTVPVQREAF